jgi:hypothetical protein
MNEDGEQRVATNKRGKFIRYYSVDNNALPQWFAAVDFGMHAKSSFTASQWLLCGLLLFLSRAGTTVRDHLGGSDCSRGQGGVAPAPRRALRLRGGGYVATDRVLQARLAAARAEVGDGWYNATATDVFPWDGWESHRRDELEGAPHVGFVAGTGRWLGPSLEQV